MPDLSSALTFAPKPCWPRPAYFGASAANEAAGEVASEAAGEVSSDVASEVASEAASEASHAATSEAAREAASTLQLMRARWTRSEVSYL